MSTTKRKIATEPKEVCLGNVLPIKDALDVLGGRWKLPILLLLSYGTKRFLQISKDLNGITDKVLSKELKELEANQLITRTVHNAFPPVVEYSITDYGRTLDKIITELTHWGKAHRKKIIGK